METIKNSISLCTNLDYLSKELSIELSELEEMSIKQIETLVQNKNKEIVENRVTQENIERYSKFFIEWDLFVNLFGEEIIPYIVKNVNFSSLVQEEFFTQEPIWLSCREFVKKGVNHYYIPPRCRKPRTTSGVYYLIPSSGQGLKHEKIIRAYLKDKFPELFEKLLVNIYEIDSYNRAEIYIKQAEEEDSIYTPIEAIMNKDITKVIDRYVECSSFSYQIKNKRVTEEDKEILRQEIENKETFKILKEILLKE